MGDFNLNWEDKSSRMKLKLILDGFNLVQLVKGPTRITNSTRTQIDLIFSNRPDRISKSFNMITGLSDHNMVLISRKLTCRRVMNAGNKEFFGIPKNKHEAFKVAINNIKWDEILLENDLEISSQILTEKLQSTIHEFSIRIKCKNKKQSLPWMNEKILKLMKERDNALKISTNSKMSTDRFKFVKLRNTVTRELRKAKADFFIIIAENSNGNSKAIWSQIQKLTGQNISIINWSKH